MNLDKEFEVVVVGSGPSGLLTATILSEHGLDVLLIEKGQNLPLDSSEQFSLHEMNSKYKNGGITTTIGNPKINYVEGSCVGGGSEVNSGLYHRIPQNIIEKWKKIYDVKNIDNDDLLEHYEVIEKELSISYMPKKPSPASLKLYYGAKNLNLEGLEIPRWVKYKGNKSKKQSMSVVYKSRYLSSGGKLVSETEVIKIFKKSNKWEIKTSKKGNVSTISAKYLFLCAGAISTPTILRSSGIKKNIGYSLQMHPTIKCVAEFNEKINHIGMGVPVHQVKAEGKNYSFGCSISSIPYLGISLKDYDEIQSLKDKWEYMAIYYAMIIPESKGLINKLPFFNDPLIRYNLNNYDLEQLSLGLKKLCELLLSTGASSLFPSISEFKPIKSKNDLAHIPNVLLKDKTNLMSVHVFSSCPMGENKNICATNSFGAVHGFDNLFINDSSILCSAPGVNPQGGIMAIARRNTYNFLSYYG